MILTGTAIKVGDNINTDTIISGRYKFQITDISELSKHLMEDLDPEFKKRILPGKTILVAGSNFAMGSSREQAPLVIKESGIIAVIAKNFARIFYRNSFNIGLPLVEADTFSIQEADKLRIDLGVGLIENETQDKSISIKALPIFMQKLISDGGIVNHFKKYGRISLK